MSVEIRNIRVDDVYPLEELQVNPSGNPFANAVIPFEKWDHNKFIAAINCKKTTVRVARVNKVVAGFIVYKQERSSLIEVKMIAVDQFYRRRGIGIALLSDVFSEAYACDSRPKIKIAAPEPLLELHLLLRRAGFKAVRVEKDKYIFEGLVPSVCGV